jgi:CubicO group peptidase (beta-lactamase class C family)
VKHTSSLVRTLLAAAMTASFAATAGAAEPTLRAKELAAGYKAAFLCSDTFTAGMPEATIAADDLRGIYPEVEPLIDALPAAIDRVAKTVSVSFDATLPPRVAVWRPLLGCSQLPIGARVTAGATLPRLPSLQPPSLDAAAWPLGDMNAVERLPAANAAALDALVAKAFDAASYGQGSTTSAVIVLRDGRIVAERYGAGIAMHTPQRTWSMAKSLAVTLIGRAVALGKVDVAAPANIPEWRAPGDPRAAITLEQLLRMNSGLWTNGPGNRTDSLYIGGSSVSETSAAAPLEAAPGSRFNYANNDILLATYSLTTSLGADALAFPFSEVLWPLGMTHTTPETDWQDHYVMSSQVWLTARDAARLALLYQNDGIANGQRLLPAGWAHFVSSTAGAQPTDRAAQYGAGFWVYGPSNGLPAGSFGMNGMRGQYAIIVPSAKVIVVRRGFDGGRNGFDMPRFTHDVLNELVNP